MADYIITEKQKVKIEEWFENYIQTTPDDLGEEYDAANDIIFQFKYLKPLIWMRCNYCGYTTHPPKHTNIECPRCNKHTLEPTEPII